jgi:hypothetical protein
LVRAYKCTQRHTYASKCVTYRVLSICARFACHHRCLLACRYSSAWLNKTSHSAADDAFAWASDGDKMMCAAEKALADFAINIWKEHGPGVAAEVPANVEARIL